MNTQPTAAEREHMGRVKALACSLCGAAGPSEAHHIDQKLPMLCIPLCASCHRDPVQGIHGQRVAWKLRKMDEMKCLDHTIRLLILGTVVEYRSAARTFQRAPKGSTATPSKMIPRSYSK